MNVSMFDSAAFEPLLRGDESLGGFLTAAGVEVVPSPKFQSPESEFEHKWRMKSHRIHVRANKTSPSHKGMTLHVRFSFKTILEFSCSLQLLPRWL